MTSSILNGLDSNTGRSMVVNWENILNRIVDDYEEHTTIPHGVQKDAVQNAWDARKDKRRARGWSAEFHLLDNGTGIPILTFQDKGTTGLTGRVLEPEELDQDLPSDERWGRFENMAFTKDPTEETLGARGQGKFIFVAASKEHTIIYDTYRDDGVYRLGTIRISSKVSGLTWAWEGDEAVQKLHEFAPSLEPLHEVGTRVVIVDPIDELIDAVALGQFTRMISETWWEIILKYEASIWVICDGREEKVAVPPCLLLHEHSPKKVSVWPKERETITVSGKRYRIKKFMAVYAPDIEVPNDVQGISVQRGGMKICSEIYRYGSEDAEKHLYGFIEFDKELDKEMARLESSTHYNFKWRRGAAKAVRQYIQQELAAFYNELGLGQDPTAAKYRKRSDAERQALRAANKAAKVLGVYGGGVGGIGSGSGGNGDSNPSKLVSLTMPELDLPTEYLRVEYGDTVKGISVTVHNRSEYEIQAYLKMYIVIGDQVIHEFISGTELYVSPKSEVPYGPYEIHISDGVFPAAGKYIIRATLISLMTDPTPGMDRKGKEIDKVSKVFYLAQDPPIGGLFEEVKPVEWETEAREKMLGRYYPGERRGYIYEYNIVHRRYEALGEEEADIAFHIFELLLQAVMKIDLESDEPSLFDSPDLESPDLIAARMSDIYGEALHNYYDD